MVNVDNFAICFIFFVHHKNKVDHDAKWDDNLSHHQSKKKKEMDVDQKLESGSANLSNLMVGCHRKIKKSIYKKI